LTRCPVRTSQKLPHIGHHATGLCAGVRGGGSYGPQTVPSFLKWLPYLHVERQGDTEHVCQGFREMLELIRHLNDDYHIAIPVEGNPVRHVRYELGAYELADEVIVLVDALLLGGALR
jgi:hypothetical protein